MASRSPKVDQTARVMAERRVTLTLRALISLSSPRPQQRQEVRSRSGASKGVYSVDILDAGPLSRVKKLEARCAETNSE